MSTTFIAKLIVKPGQEKEIERLQVELAEVTKKSEPDCLVYDFIRHRTEPRTYVVYARFRDEAAFQAHMKAPFHDRLVPPILAALAQDMDLQFFDCLA
ncbi:MAG: antibiotic biosynthesis monooxygenase [Proteobacteria bacterium]|nr:antibiotic biosynthesis monooxygenase [Pseudomonadota bacterium]